MITIKSSLRATENSGGNFIKSRKFSDSFNNHTFNEKNFLSLESLAPSQCGEIHKRVVLINSLILAVFSSVCVLALTLSNVIMASPTNVDQQFAKASNTFAAELYQVRNFAIHHL